MIENDNESAGSGSILGWLTRTYEVHQEWIKTAREIFFDGNGDSELARHRVSTLVRAYFLEKSPVAEVVQRWSGLVQVDERVVPPKVTASNASYFDWLRAADHLLLSCGSLTDEYLEENQRRENNYQLLLGSFTLRMQINAARELIHESPAKRDAESLATLQQKYPNASLANVKEARRLEAVGEQIHSPVEPLRAGDMPLYKSLTNAAGLR